MNKHLHRLLLVFVVVIGFSWAGFEHFWKSAAVWLVFFAVLDLPSYLKKRRK